MPDDIARVEDFRLKRRFQPVRFRDVRLSTGRPYLVKGLIPREGLTVVWGPPKCGKSFWVFDLMLHLALEWEYRGRRVQPGTVCYVACEGERGSWRPQRGVPAGEDQRGRRPALLSPDNAARSCSRR